MAKPHLQISVTAGFLPEWTGLKTRTTLEKRILRDRKGHSAEVKAGRKAWGKGGKLDVPMVRLQKK